MLGPLVTIMCAKFEVSIFFGCHITALQSQRHYALLAF